MKQLTCEMCGSNDLVKHDGVFVCQSCGCKYSVEEAKKMMVEGNVKVTGNVKINHEKELAGIIALAREIYENEDLVEIDDKDFKKILKYCNEGLKLDSNCKELLEMKANIYIATEKYNKGFGVLKIFFGDEKYDDKLAKYFIDFQNNVVLNRENTSYLEADRQRYFDGSVEEFFYPIINKVNIYSSDLLCKIYRCIIRSKIAFIISNLHDSGVILNINEIEPNGEIIGNWSAWEATKRALAVTKDLENRILKIDASYKVSNDEIIVYERIIESNMSRIKEDKNDICNRIPYAVSLYEDGMKSIEEAVSIIKKLQQTDSLPIEEQINQLKNEIRPAKKSGCYVATCVYGTYDCPQVWTLRRFRDNTLAETTLGRVFICIYYAISPTLVKWLGDTTWFKKMGKGTLDRMVSKLHENGVEDTPYQDRKW